MRLTLISYHSRLNDDFEEIALRAVPSPGHQFRRVQTRAGLLEAVAEAAFKPQCLTRLDLYGHGSPGGMNMGEELLVRLPRSEHWTLLTGLLPYLSEGAQLRLLACHAAAGPEGRRLLVELESLLAPRSVRVFGAITRLGCRDFGADGFLPEREWMLASLR